MALLSFFPWIVRSRRPASRAVNSLKPISLAFNPLTPDAFRYLTEEGKRQEKSQGGMAQLLAFSKPLKLVPF